MVEFWRKPQFHFLVKFPSGVARDAQRNLWPCRQVQGFRFIHGEKPRFSFRGADRLQIQCCAWRVFCRVGRQQACQLENNADAVLHPRQQQRIRRVGAEGDFPRCMVEMCPTLFWMKTGIAK
jgi:hypothetical protein